jgi:hypothetical protein
MPDWAVYLTDPISQIEDRGTYVIKPERPGFPEAEKYKALNEVGAPVVQLLDVIEDGCSRKIVLEKATPLSFDASEMAGFQKVFDWVVEFNAASVTKYPPCNLDYFSSYWTVTSQLIALAGDPSSQLYRHDFDALPPTSYIFREFQTMVASRGICISHGDPDNANLGMIAGKVVAFDLHLSWLSSPFADLVLRTGAQVTPYPKLLGIESLIESYTNTLSADSPDPVRDYSICGAIYGVMPLPEGISPVSTDIWTY